MCSKMVGAMFLLSACLTMNAPGAVAQGPASQNDTLVGCLNPADRPGFYTLREEGTGFLITITGTPQLQAHAGNNEVRLTGGMAREQGLDVFHAASVERLSGTCPPVQVTMEGFREAVGRAIVGVRGGIGFDPELIYLGAHAQVGPIIQNLWLRPSYEFGFGEVTKINSFNFDFAYYLPVTARPARGTPSDAWSVFLGIGPAWHLARQSFEAEDNGEEIEFSDWNLEGGLNFLVGISKRTGFFLRAAGRRLRQSCG